MSTAESAFLVAEQLTFDEVGRQSGTFYFNPLYCPESTSKIHYMAVSGLEFRRDICGYVKKVDSLINPP
jgi:hypothetical protein